MMEEDSRSITACLPFVPSNDACVVLTFSTCRKLTSGGRVEGVAFVRKVGPVADEVTLGFICFLGCEGTDTGGGEGDSGRCCLILILGEFEGAFSFTMSKRFRLGWQSYCFVRAVMISDSHDQSSLLAWL